MGEAQDTERVAADWIARSDRGLRADERNAREAWLEADASHRVAWLRLRAAWRCADDLADEPLAVRPTARTWSAMSTRFRPQATAAAVAACALLAVLVALELRPDGVAYATDVGGRSSAPLEDGSRIELNTDSRVRVDVGPRRRIAWLDKGEAYFDVAHDPEHPFVIHAGDRRVTVLGTRFTVRREGDRLEVAVADGRVRVDQPGARTLLPRVVIVGDRLVAEGPSMRVDHVGEQAVADEMGWRQGAVVFQDTTLAEAAAELNRYNRVQLVISDAGSAELRIGGSVDPLNVEAFAALLRDAYGLKTERQGDLIYISSGDTGLS